MNSTNISGSGSVRTVIVMCGRPAPTKKIVQAIVGRGLAVALCCQHSQQVAARHICSVVNADDAICLPLIADQDTAVSEHALHRVLDRGRRPVAFIDMRTESAERIPPSLPNKIRLLLACLREHPD